MGEMEEQEVLERLCYRDARNPFHGQLYDRENPDSDGDCFCDNCFRGRTPLALEILRLREVIWDLEQRYVYEG
jgi:hypothetical protein